MKFHPFILSLLAWAVPLVAQANQGNLSKEEARSRSDRISDVAYDISVRIDGTEAEFSGRTMISFGLRSVDKPVAADFSGGRVTRLVVNGVQVPPPPNGNRIVFAADLLKKGPNRVEISYAHPYSTTGDGLYRFRDPVGGETYLYSNFEPFAANQFFPCFDQPDLKVTYKLTVDAPAAWTVISAAKETAVAGTPGRRTWTFPAGRRFSTYLISLHAGPYVQWSGHAGKVPLRLFARRSLAPFVDHKEWLGVTQKGFEFYERYFDHAYPFEKYDQIIVPDFNWSGMENVGAVAYSERLVFRGRPTRGMRLFRTEIILHELAHLWFGDLVTMRWWDDLWLNESFASYMSALALAEKTEFSDAWTYFHWRMKRWAYGEDRVAQTHPIQSSVPDTASSFAAFDGITYGKGASVLKQLAFFLGPDKFRDGIRIYLKAHAYANADLNDFISALEKSSGRDLNEWKSQWLASAGLSKLKSSFTCEGGRLDTITIEQKRVSGAPTLRQHKTELALFAASKEGVKLAARIPVAYGASVMTLKHPADCPVFLLGNYGDQDYALLDPDPESRKHARLIVTGGADPLTRTLVWHLLWDAVRDGRLTAENFAELALAAMPKESDLLVLSGVMDHVVGRDVRSASALAYFPQQGESNQDQGIKIQERLEALAWEQLSASAAGSDRQLTWFDFAVRTTVSSDRLAQLSLLLSDKRKIPGMALDQDRRWNLIIRLNMLDPTAHAELVDRERKRDFSDEGRKLALSAEMARPSVENKRAQLRGMADDTIPEALSKRAMAVLFPYRQRSVLSDPDLRREVYALLIKFASSKDQQFLKSFTYWAAPVACSPQGNRELDQFLAAQKDLPAIARKNLETALEEGRVCASLLQPDP